jgi:biopolymer transport protein ExbD/DNA-directed RNA polymerase subunit RPC12/RpoP
MSLRFTCIHCGREIKTYVRAAGRRVRCPDCDTPLVIPQPSVAESQAAAVQGDERMADLRVYDDLEIVEDLPELPPPPPVRPAPPTPAPPAPVPPAPQSQPRPAAPRRPARKQSQRRPARAASGSETPFLPPLRSPPEDLIDMTAMVDIVFFLLIFFLVTSLQALEAVMNMPTPQQTTETGGKVRSVAEFENDPNYIMVQIEEDDSVWVEETQVFNDQDLRARLRAARDQGDRPRSLLVIGNADASHAAAVRVFDAGASAGVSGISFLVQEQNQRDR